MRNGLNGERSDSPFSSNRFTLCPPDLTHSRMVALRPASGAEIEIGAAREPNA